jgi:hypothetical protein
MIIFCVHLIGCAVPTFRVPMPQGVGLDEAAAKLQVPSLFKHDDASYKALVHAVIKAGGQTQALRYALLRDDKKFRVEVYPTTSFYAVAKFVTDGQQFSYSDSSRESIVREPLKAETLEDLFGLSVSQEELSAVLFGVVPQEGLTYRYYLHDDVLSLYGYRQGETEHPAVFARASVSDGKLATVVFLDQQDVRLEVQSREFDSKHYPQRLKLLIPRFSSEIDLTVKQRLLHPTFPEESFALPHL